MSFIYKGQNRKIIYLKNITRDDWNIPLCTPLNFVHCHPFCHLNKFEYPKIFYNFNKYCNLYIKLLIDADNVHMKTSDIEYRHDTRISIINIDASITPNKCVSYLDNLKNQARDMIVEQSLRHNRNINEDTDDNVNAVYNGCISIKAIIIALIKTDFTNLYLLCNPRCPNFKNEKSNKKRDIICNELKQIKKGKYKIKDDNKFKEYPGGACEIIEDMRTDINWKLSFRIKGQTKIRTIYQYAFNYDTHVWPDEVRDFKYIFTDYMDHPFTNDTMIIPMIYMRGCLDVHIFTHRFEENGKKYREIKLFKNTDKHKYDQVQEYDQIPVFNLNDDCILQDHLIKFYG
jgi:hypothetical protein